MNIHLNNEGQEYKIDSVRGRVLVEEEGECGQCTLYSCMKIEH
jgi:hypothetical protein